MITREQLERMKSQPTQEDIPALIAEVERLKQYIADYSATVTQKIDLIEQNMIEFENENNRLVDAKERAFIERDACIGLVLQLSVTNGLKAGVVPGNIAVVDLPSGQVSWQYNESEAHLFSQLSTYSNPIEEMPIEEKYRRVMNPGLPTSDLSFLSNLDQ